MKYIDYQRVYRGFGKLGFPYPERVYFDSIGAESSHITRQQKLLDIGYLFTHGYDVKSVIYHTFSDAHITGTEDDV